MALQDSYFSSSILERFENALVTVNYSNLPHSQDYLAPGNKRATDKIAAELCIHAMNGACGVVCSIPPNSTQPISLKLAHIKTWII